MMVKLKHIICLLALFLTAKTFSQQDICVIAGEEIVFNLKRDWSEEKREEVSAQYGLDSAVIAKALGEKILETMHFENADWTVKYPDANTVSLHKGVSQLKGKWNYKKQVLMSPEGNTKGLKTGPGYVDHSKVVFGVNSLSKNVIVQYLDGSTKFILPGFENADEVHLVGSFNDWDMYGLPMKRTSQGWEKTIDLEPGKYLYKFIVDGNWIRDPNNNLRESDGYQGYNSIVYRYNEEFELKGFKDAKKVILSGSFNGWNEKEARMAQTSKGWAIPVYLKQGTYNYKFIVDKEWITDPSNPKTRDNGMGNKNSVISIGQETEFELIGFEDASSVILTGSFNGWNEGELVMDKTSKGWSIGYALPPGNYEYKFIIDGEWIPDPKNPYHIYHGDYVNSFLSIDQNHIFRLSGYKDAKSVIVTGSFTGWSEGNNRMIQKDGEWIFPINLMIGKHTYKFIVDGEWIIDPANHLYEENEYGTDNSILWISDEKQLTLNKSLK